MRMKDEWPCDNVWRRRYRQRNWGHRARRLYGQQVRRGSWDGGACSWRRPGWRRYPAWPYWRPSWVYRKIVWEPCHCRRRRGRRGRRRAWALWEREEKKPTGDDDDAEGLSPHSQSESESERALERVEKEAAKREGDAINNEDVSLKDWNWGQYGERREFFW